MADPIRPEQSHLSTKPLRSLWFLVRLGSQVRGIEQDASVHIHDGSCHELDLGSGESL
jgi:hypothetical protein